MSMRPSSRPNGWRFSRSCCRPYLGSRFCGTQATPLEACASKERSRPDTVSASRSSRSTSRREATRSERSQRSDAPRPRPSQYCPIRLSRSCDHQSEAAWGGHERCQVARAAASRVAEVVPAWPSGVSSHERRRHLRAALSFLRGFVEGLAKPIKKDGREHIEYVPTQIVTSATFSAPRAASGSRE